MQPLPFTKTSEAAETLTEEQGQRLCRYARDCIREELGGPRAERPAGAWADRVAATFVTLRRDGDLHGCIGSLEPRRKLADDVAKNAVAAALRDPRAPFIELGDEQLLSVEVSLLSPLEPVPAESEDEAIRALRPGVDGALLRYRGFAGTFLPQVWASLPDPALFFRELKQKAGLAADFWADGVTLLRYTVTKYVDSPARKGDS